MRIKLIVASVIGASALAAIIAGISHMGSNTLGKPSVGVDAVGQSTSKVDRTSLRRAFQSSASVVQVRVLSIGASQWSTPDGSAPTLSALRSSRFQILPVTPVMLRTERT